MKKSDLKSYIKENIINILSEDLDEKEEQVDIKKWQKKLLIKD